MSYLGEFRRSHGKLQEKQNDSTGNSNDKQLFNWTAKDHTSESDKPAVTKTSTTEEPRLRVSNLLSKRAFEKRIGGGVSLNRFVDGWQKFWGNPIAASLGIGAVPALGYYAFSKFTSPDDKEDPEIRAEAGRLMKEDMAALGEAAGDADYYLEKAISQQKSSRLKWALGLGLGTALLSHLRRVNPADWSALYKYRPVAKTQGVRHEASMLGTDMGQTADYLRSAIMFNDKLTPEMKHNALGVIDYAPSNYMTSTDIVNNAISSGISGSTGLPMGRIITAAAVDAAAGYGIGKLLGANRPGRVAGIFGAGSALASALKYYGS